MIQACGSADTGVGVLVGTGSLGQAGCSKCGQQAKYAAGTPDSSHTLAAGLPPDSHVTCLLAEAAAVTSQQPTAERRGSGVCENPCRSVAAIMQSIPDCLQRV